MNEASDNEPTKNKGGRPPSYNRELADEILERLMGGESLAAICREDAMPSYTTVYKWVADDTDEFADRYTRARLVQADYYADQLVDVAISALGVASGAPGTGEAGARVQAKKLHMDALKWKASKLAPKKYSDKVQQEITGADGGPIKQESALSVTPEVEAEIRRISKVSSQMQKPEGLE